MYKSIQYETIFPKIDYYMSVKQELESQIEHIDLLDIKTYPYDVICKSYIDAYLKRRSKYHSEDNTKVGIFGGWFTWLRGIYNETKDPAAFYLVIRYAFGNRLRYNKQGKCNSTYRGITGHDLKIDDLRSLPISGIDFYNEDYKDFLLRAKEDDFVFLDPPYHNTTNQLYFTDEDFIELRNILKDAKWKYMLIINKDDFTYELFKDFNIYEYDFMYALADKEKSNKKQVKHLMIKNY